ncbi:MAG: SpoIIE family protein phosphatase [Planctomycetota bacterium]|nr:SpoIIE family protein phosphatase [Planctomycetota bacterium]
MDATSRTRIREIAQQLSQIAELSSPSQAMGGIDPEFMKGLAKFHQVSESSDIAKNLAQMAVRFTGGERAFVMLVSEEKRLRFAAGENVTSGELQGGIPLARHIIQQALASSEIVADEFEGRAVACVPVLYFPNNEEEQLLKLGLLYVDCGERVDAITDQVLELLENLVEHAATAIHKCSSGGEGGGGASSERVQELEEKVEELEELKANVSKLTNVGKEISSTLDMDALFIKIVDYVIEIGGAQRGFLMMVENGEPVYKIGRNFRKAEIPMDYFEFSRSVTHKTITEKKPQIVVVSSEDDFDPSRSMVAMQLKSVMCVPLMEKNNVLGLVYLDSQQASKEFSQSDAELLQSLCGQAAVALLNAKLLSEVTEKERIRNELDLASKIQLELLPKQEVDIEGLEVKGRMIPAKEVGGDYYDFIPHVGTNKSMTIAIGDVSGKGVGAGLVMIMARSIIRSAILHSGVPRSTTEIMRNLNSLFCEDLRKGMFMTVTICNWWADTNTITYTGAGHEHIMIYRAQTATVETFKAGGVATGVLARANAMYQEKSFQLAEGDVCLLYTDGVTEAMDEEHEEWEIERLEAVVKANGDKTPLDLINIIYQEIRTFVGRAEQHDDITMVAMKAKPRLFSTDMSSEMEGLLDVFGE